MQDNAGQAGKDWRKQLMVIWEFVAANSLVFALLKAFLTILWSDMVLDKATPEILAWYPWLIAGFTACTLMQVIFILRVFKIKEVPPSARLATVAAFSLVLIYFDYKAYDLIRGITAVLEYQFFN